MNGEDQLQHDQQFLIILKVEFLSVDTYVFRPQ